MKKTLLLLALLFCLSRFYSSHILGGNISYECLGNNTYVVSLTTYEDCATAFTQNSPNTISITNSCNSSIQQVSLPNVIHQQAIPYCMAPIQTLCNGGTILGAYLHMWQDTIVLSDTCNYTFSHTGCCWSMPINIIGSGNFYYWESTLINDNSSCNSSSIISTSNPIPTFCVNQPVTYNITAINPDSNILNYSLIDLMSSSGVNIAYPAGYSGAQPISGITINSLTGELQFTPTIIGNYIFSILIEEFDNSGNLVGSIIHDFTSYVVNTPGCTNDPCPSCLPAYSEVSCVTCYNGNDGYVASSPQGNNGPWDILLIDQATNTTLNYYYATLNTVVFQPLNAGDYIIRTIDSSGCSFDDSITICEPPELFLSVSNDTAICFGNSTTINADITGGVPPYYPHWSNGNWGATNYVSPLNTTSYVLTLLDDFGCQKQDTVTIYVNTVNSTTSVNGNVLSATQSGASYQWINCDNNFVAIVGETNQTFTANANGNYAVQVVENGCVDTSSCIGVTGIGILENSFGENFIVFPNPTNGNLSIELGNTYENVFAKIFTLKGQKTGKYEFHKTNKIDLVIDQANGFYFIELVASGNKKAVIKVLKH